MSLSAVAPSPDNVSIWEQAYHDAWRHFQTCIVGVLDRLACYNPSIQDRQTTIERLGQLTVEVDNIRIAGQAMFEHVPGCQTVREGTLTYFADDFIEDCLELHFKLNMLSWRLMNRPHSDRTVYNRLLMLLDSTMDRVPE
ncbi:hypothetical protein PEX2_099630 [Penicillium expansum]|uniref:Uncharacterized protein n=1 Tax=Penicillium expansum TaxID=27334 RepID=A0A0A2JZP6_PENEN|nr:hypothetical protein PEX2_099630 [Penicillium expansum]KGO60947.1 hypothetical protein PEX2_099630 [Penicillium expansum]